MNKAVVGDCEYVGIGAVCAFEDQSSTLAVKQARGIVRTANTGNSRATAKIPKVASVRADAVVERRVASHGWYQRWGCEEAGVGNDPTAGIDCEDLLPVVLTLQDPAV